MYSGGLLYRLVSDSFYFMIKDSMGDLGWFDAGRQHKPLQFRNEQVADDETIEPNFIAVSDENLDNDDIELGSNLSEHRFFFFIDIYGENDSISLHLAGDVKDILEGRFGAIGRTSNTFPVLDLTQATPVPIVECEIENVFMDRNRFFQKPYQKYWRVVACEVIFTYSSDGL